MSPTEIPIIPNPHVPTITHLGVASWRPVITSLTVHPAVDERHLVLTVDGKEIHRFRLARAEAEHLAGLLLQAPAGPAD